MRLAPDPMSVSTARGLVVRELEQAGYDDLIGDAVLLVSELVCNAVMHARTAILLHVTVKDTVTSGAAEGVRVEVDDGSPQLPRWSPSTDDMISGRGLTLVNSLATTWGAQPLPIGGKTVWFELDHGMQGADGHEGEGAYVDAGDGTDLDGEALLEQWAALEDIEEPPGILIEMSPSRARSLLDSRNHGDSVIREYQLLLLNSQGQVTVSDVPPRVLALARRLDAAAVEFASARRQIRAAALTAVSRGEEFVAVKLRLDPEDAIAAERYRDALDEADDQARSGIMLIESTGDEARARRHAYLSEVASRLRAAGQPRAE